MSDLDSILSGEEVKAAPEPTPEAETPAVEAPETETQEATGEHPEADAPKDDRPRDEAGRFAKEQTPKEPAAPPAEKEAEHIPFAALKDEREKRQRLERELQDLRQKLTPQEQPKRPDLWEDPDAFRQDIETRVQREIANTRITMSEQMVRSQHEDYDAVLERFGVLAQTKPHIAQTILAEAFNSPNPALHTYQRARDVLDLEEAGGLQGYRERLEAEIREKLTAEMAPQAATQTPTVPRSLAQERSAGSPKGAAWAGPQPLSDILAG